MAHGEKEKSRWSQVSFYPEERDGISVLRARPLEQAGALALFTLRPLSLLPSEVRSPERVARDRERFANLFLPGPPVTVRQVHGTRVLAVETPGDGAETGWRGWGEADGLSTARPDLPLAVFCADCAPVYLYDPDRQAVALLHAGWRGTLAGIPGEGARLLRERYGSLPGRLLAAVGPCLGPCCYEVGPEVELAVREALGREAPRVLRRREGRLFFDLPGSIRLLLQEAGILPGRLFLSGLCTACHPELFWSHRRDKGKTGRMAAVLALRGQR